MNEWDKIIADRLKGDFSIEKHFNIVPIQEDQSSEAKELALNIARSRGMLLLDLPFFGSLLGRLKIVMTREPKIGTYAADTRRLYFNTEYAKDLPRKRIKAILLHLVIHLIMGHGKMPENYDADIWRYAIEVYTVQMVNEILLTIYSYNSQRRNDEWDTISSSKIPKAMYKKDIEEYYDLLYEYAHNHLNRKEKVLWDKERRFGEKVLKKVEDYCSVGTPCNFQQVYHLIYNEQSGNIENLSSDRFTGLIREAFVPIGNRKNISEKMLEHIDDLIDPRISWDQQLAEHIQKIVVPDFRWIPLNRRYVEKNYVLPAIKKEFLDVVVVLDLCPNLTFDQMENIITTVYDVSNSYSHICLHVITSDQQVQGYFVIEPGQPLELENYMYYRNSAKDLIKDEASEAFPTVFDFLEIYQVMPAIVIYATDGSRKFPEILPNYNILWLYMPSYDVNRWYFPESGPILYYTTELGRLVENYQYNVRINKVFNYLNLDIETPFYATSKKQFDQYRSQDKLIYNFPKIVERIKILVAGQRSQIAGKVIRDLLSFDFIPDSMKNQIRTYRNDAEKAAMKTKLAKYNGIEMDHRDAKVLVELERMLGRILPQNGTSISYKVEYQSVVYLKILNTNLRNIPEEIGNLQNLTKLRIVGNEICSLPSSFGNLENLIHLYLKNNQIETLPESIGKLKNLAILDLSSNDLVSLPENIGDLQNLARFDLSHNQLTSLPQNIGKLKSLIELDIASNQLESLTEDIGKLKSLWKLDLSHNQLVSLPNNITKLGRLRTLNLRNNSLSYLPENIYKLWNLTRLNLSKNQISSLPNKKIGLMQSLIELDLRDNPIANNKDRKKLAKLLYNCDIHI